MSSELIFSLVPFDSQASCERTSPQASLCMPGQKSLGSYESLAWSASLHVGVSKTCWEISIQPFFWSCS